MAKDQDLFDDTTMSFGEHLEVLRVHVIKALIGLVIAVCVSLLFADKVLYLMQFPLMSVMRANSMTVQNDVAATSANAAWYAGWFGTSGKPAEKPEDTPAPVKQLPLVVSFEIGALLAELHERYPDRFSAPAPNAKPDFISLPGQVDRESVKAMLQEMSRESDLTPRTDDIDEAFMIWMKVAMIVGLLLASPWIFYQLWLFVAAGLYPHEKAYVYKFVPLSIGLFLGGSIFCFFIVMPIVISFLASFNTWLNLRQELKMTNFITWSMSLSVMFGLSFQLPLVMMVLDKLNIVTAAVYREQWRMAVMIMAVLAVVLTPSDPYSMILMLVPLLLLYAFGIFLCSHSPALPGRKVATARAS